MHGRHNTTFPKMTTPEILDDMTETWLTLYDWLESGATVEQINLELDFLVADRGWHPKIREHFRYALERITELRAEGGDRNELLRYLETVKAKYLAGTLED
jgi:hypothetical protein